MKVPIIQVTENSGERDQYGYNVKKIHPNPFPQQNCRTLRRCQCEPGDIRAIKSSHKLTRIALVLKGYRSDQKGFLLLKDIIKTTIPYCD